VPSETHQIQLFLEISAVFFNLLFIVFLIREQRVSWVFGIIASIESVALFLMLDKPLYSEALLYSVYVVLGFYGYAQWGRGKAKTIEIHEWTWQKHLKAFGIGLSTFIGLGYFVSYHFDQPEMPFEDAFSTAFSFLATYMEAKKVLSAWIYWVVLNLFSVWLYLEKELQYYPILMFLFTIFSIMGYVRWRNKMLERQLGN
jgi:nicotinamide mononucleotide transporter